MKKVGYDVSREYYVNDAGRQIDILTVSVMLRLYECFNDKEFPNSGYKGKYIIDQERLNKINTDFLPSKTSEKEVLETIKKVYEKFDIVLDPHSAIGYGAFDKVNLKGNNIVLATAHPCKFPGAIEKAINIKAELPDELLFILDEKENYDIIENNLNKIKKHIKERI